MECVPLRNGHKTGFNHEGVVPAYQSVFVPGMLPLNQSPGFYKRKQIKFEKLVFIFRRIVFCSKL